MAQLFSDLESTGTHEGPLMFEPALRQFNSIIGERTAARLKLDRVLIRGHVPERYQAVQTYVEALDRCIAELEIWSAAVGGRIEAYREGMGVPPADDPFWELLRTTAVGSWVVSLRQERDVLASELAAIDELNAAPHERDEPSNGAGPSA